MFDPYNYPFWIFILIILVGAIAVISRPFSTYIKFAYPNAWFEAVGNPFIEEKELSRLLDSKNLTEFKDTLNSMKDYDIIGENSQEIQQSLDEAFFQTLSLSKKDSSKDMTDFFNAFIEKIDIYLIKNEIKNKLNNKEINNSSIDKSILQKTKNFLEDLSTIEKDKLKELVRNFGFGLDVINVFSDDKIDFLKLDTAIDKHAICILKKVKVPRGCEKGKQKFVNRMIDIKNIKSILRAKQLQYDEKTCMKFFLGDGEEIASWKFEEMTQSEHVSQVISSLEGTSYYDILKDSIEQYNNEKSVQVLENSLDSLYLKFLKDISLKNYVNIGPTIRFIISKEFEIRNLKIITKGIVEKIQLDIIKNLLIKEVS